MIKTGRSRSDAAVEVPAFVVIAVPPGWSNSKIRIPLEKHSHKSDLAVR